MNWTLPASLLALFSLGCGKESGSPIDDTPKSLSCRDVTGGFADELQGPFEGRLVVWVRNPYSVMRAGEAPRPVAGAIVRVENESMQVEATTDSSGCVEFEDPSLSAPFSIHVFGADPFVRSIFRDDRRVQVISLPQGTPSEVQGFREINVTVTGLDRIPATGVGRKFVTVTRADRFWAPPFQGPLTDFQDVVQDSSAPFVVEVEPGSAPQIVAIAGEVTIFDDIIEGLVVSMLGVAQAPATDGAELSIELTHPIQTPVRLEVAAPPPHARGLVASPGIKLPGSKSSIALGRTSSSSTSRSIEILAPDLGGSLSGTFRPTIFTSWSSGEDFVSTSISAESASTTDLSMPPWLPISGDVVLDGRTLRLPVSDVNRCEVFTRSGPPQWRAFVFSSPWEVEFPEPPPGLADPFRSDVRFLISCSRVTSGDPHDLELEGEASLSISR